MLVEGGVEGWEGSVVLVSCFLVGNNTTIPVPLLLRSGFRGAATQRRLRGAYVYSLCISALDADIALNLRLEFRQNGFV